MYIVRRKARRKSGAEVMYLNLRHAVRTEAGPRERTLYLAPELAPDVYERAAKACRRRGYTPKQVEAVLAAVRARVEENRHEPIAVRGKPVVWRDPKKA